MILQLAIFCVVSTTPLSSDTYTTEAECLTPRLEAPLLAGDPPNSMVIPEDLVSGETVDIHITGDPNTQVTLMIQEDGEPVEHVEIILDENGEGTHEYEAPLGGTVIFNAPTLGVPEQIRNIR